MMTMIASTATTAEELTPSLCSTYSCGRLASSAVRAMRPSFPYSTGVPS